jgi:ammonia channel protein AmtB
MFSSLCHHHGGGGRGALLERNALSAVLIFMSLWTLIVLRTDCPLGLGPSGWLARLGVLDFAGGGGCTSTPVSPGWCAPMCLGPRRGYGSGLFAFQPGLTMAAEHAVGRLVFFNAGSSRR